MKLPVRPEMRRNVVLSVAFHLVVVAVAYFGVPALPKRDVMPEQVVAIDVVNVAPQTNAPPSQPKPEPPKPAPPKPEPAKAPPPPPEPPKPVEAAKPPEPTPAPAPKAEPAPKPLDEKKKEEVKKKEEPKPAPPPQPALAKTQPKKKPPPPDNMASVLKTLEKLKQQPPDKDKKAKQEPKPAPKEETFDVAQIQKSLNRPQRHDPSKPISISEIDLVRRQIAACWNLPAGAKDAHNMTVEVRANLNPDGTVRDARLVESARLGSDPFYRAMAESALRAVLNPRCQPFKLPPDRYDIWQTLVLNFDPREIL